MGPEAPYRRAWQATSNDPESNFTNWPVVDDGVVFARSAGGLLAVNGKDGSRLWFVDGGGSRQVAPALSSTAVFLPLGSRQMVALDRVTGDELWAFESGRGGDLDPSPTLSGDTLVFSLPDDRAIYALDSASGEVRWKLETDLSPDYVPAISGNLLVVPTEEVGTPRVLVLALNAATGEEAWRADQLESASSVSIADGKVFFGGGDLFAHALDLKTGEEIWRSPVEDKFDPWNMPALAFGDVFLADRVGNIYRLDGETGRREWIFTETEGTMDQSFPVIAGQTLFIGSGAGFLYAIDTETGRLLWQDRVRGIVQSGAADEERFYFGVKLGADEGLHAYEHDPEGELAAPPGRDLGPLGSLVGGLVLFLLLFTGVILYVRRKRASAE
ncbi:MAG: PQQ-binding-like beta-propeller repeat protein [Actinomycetota bacterium]